VLKILDRKLENGSKDLGTVIKELEDLKAKTAALESEKSTLASDIFEGSKILGERDEEIEEVKQELKVAATEIAHLDSVLLDVKTSLSTVQAVRKTPWGCSDWVE